MAYFLIITMEIFVLSAQQGIITRIITPKPAVKPCSRHVKTWIVYGRVEYMGRYALHTISMVKRSHDLDYIVVLVAQVMITRITALNLQRFVN